jgi:2-polyprenyl-6-methoxyphenol hydroxylase-like FAD-dependent oxidoreductase
MECRYLVAADGANSQIRRLLGVAMRGKPALQHLVNIHFTAPALRQRLAGREAMLYFVFNASVIAVLVAHDLRRGEFVAQVHSWAAFSTEDRMANHLVSARHGRV